MACIDSINVYPSCVTIKKGKWYYGAYAVVSRTSNCCCRDVRWYSDNCAVASVNANTGYIYANGIGTTRIYAVATDNSCLEDYVTVTVISGDVKATSVQICGESGTVEVGHTIKFNATVSPATASNKTVNWSSSNTEVATVDANGTVTGKSKGQVVITATANDGSKVNSSCAVRVTETILAKSVTVSPSEKSIAEGGGFWVRESVMPAEVTNGDVVWSSSDTSIATVTSGGLVMAQSAGTATITATTVDGSNKSGSCIVTVTPPIAVQSVEICAEDNMLRIGQSMKLRANIYPINAKDQRVIWSSSDESVATVGMYTGVVIAKKIGKVTITVETEEGYHSNEIELKIMRDTVIVQPDGIYYKAVFIGSGKVWHCIKEDLIYDETPNPNRQNLILRANENLYVDFNEEQFKESDITLKTYSDEELKVLYKIDPFGVAKYIEQYAYVAFVDLKDKLCYKDYMFEMLFNKKPTYYARATPTVWATTTDKSYLKGVLSESELLFGAHNILDAFSHMELVLGTIDILGIIASCVFTLPCFKGGAWKTIKDVVEVFSFIWGTLTDGIDSAIWDKAIGDAEEFDDSEKLLIDNELKSLENTSISWVFTFISTYSSLYDIVESINEKQTLYPQIFEYCTDVVNYDVRLQLASGEICRLDDINANLI